MVAPRMGIKVVGAELTSLAVPGPDRPGRRQPPAAHRGGAVRSDQVPLAIFLFEGFEGAGSFHPCQAMRS